MTKPSYHDLHITTAKIPRTSIFNLPSALEITCTRTRGWTLWDHSESARTPAPIYRHDPKLVAGEYEGPKHWLVLDVAGHVIVDSRQDVKV